MSLQLLRITIFVRLLIAYINYFTYVVYGFEFCKTLYYMNCTRKKNIH